MSKVTVENNPLGCNKAAICTSVFVLLCVETGDLSLEWQPARHLQELYGEWTSPDDSGTKGRKQAYE